MAVVQNPIVGRAKQKMANAVFSTWKGRNVVRSKPLTVGNPRTVGQVRSRNILATLSNLAKKVRVVILKSLKTISLTQTEYNSLLQLNYEQVTTNTEGIVTTVSNALSFAVQNADIANFSVTNIAVVTNDVTITLSRNITTSEKANYDWFLVSWGGGVTDNQVAVYSTQIDSADITDDTIEITVPSGDVRAYNRVVAVAKSDFKSFETAMYEVA